MTGLQSIVESLLRPDDMRSVAWHDLIAHRNVAPLPSPHPASDTVWSRGFDFLLLDATGEPSHFGRCRASDDQRAVRACGIRTLLSEDDDLATLIPRTRFLTDGPLLVELSRYVRGTPFILEVARLGPEAMAAAARQIIDAARLVTSRAEERIATLRGDGREVGLRVQAESALTLLRQAGLDERREAALAAALDLGGSVPPRVQHGDLWPANVLRGGEAWVLLDFEVFGEVRVPLYDVFHLLRSCLSMRARRDGTFVYLDVLGSATRDAAACRSIVLDEARRHALAPARLVGAFTYYVVDMTAKVRGRALPEAIWGPYWHCLEAFADRLLSRAPIHQLLVGTSAPPRSA